MAYIDNDDISDRHFEGETVPGVNTIDTSRNTSYITTTTIIINGALLSRPKADGDVTDTYGILKVYALILYGRLLENENEDFNPVDPERFNDVWWHKQIVRKHGVPALARINPSRDWSRPSPR